MTTLSILPIHYDLQVTRGTDNSFEFLFSNPEIGTAYDISGDTIVLLARLDTFDGTLKLNKTKAPGSHSAPLEGRTIITLTKVDLADAPVSADDISKWLYAVRRIPASGYEQVWFSGLIYLNPTVAAAV